MAKAKTVKQAFLTDIKILRARGSDLLDVLREDLVAERIAIDSYGEMIRYLGDGDITTRRMLEGILAMEEEHADDLSGLLAGLGS